MSRQAIGMLFAGAALLLSGCDGITVVLPDLPQECFQQDVVDTDCFTETRFVEVCEEDFLGFVVCYDEEVVDVVCEDFVVDSFLVCE